MKFFPSIAALVLTASAAHAAAVVELFTSEGCSSCPPADVVLSELGERDDTIVLSWHVDYWDRLGWKDPFSFAEYSERQRDYGRAFRLRSIYTPQMIVNGTRQFVGSDAARAKSEVARAGEHSVALELADIELTDGVVRARVTTSRELPERNRLLAILTEDELTTQSIPRGENRGRTLHHDGVVRIATEVEGAPKEFSIRLDKTWNVKQCHLVVIAERGVGGGISGATSLALDALTN